MMAWPTDDDMLIRHYVRTCPIRTRSTQGVARSTLWRFQQFVRTSRPNEPLSQATLTAWLHHVTTQVAHRSVIDQARRVDGFLDWLVAQALLATNPWAELRHHYGYQMAPIVRAFLTPNPTEALDALRPLPRFGSHLGPAMRQHLTHRRSLGFRYE